jgi:hypothetical protein
LYTLNLFLIETSKAAVESFSAITNKDNKPVRLFGGMLFRGGILHKRVANNYLAVHLGIICDHPWGVINLKPLPSRCDGWLFLMLRPTEQARGLGGLTALIRWGGDQSQTLTIALRWMVFFNATPHRASSGASH